MIHLDWELNKVLSTQDMYDIINFSIQAADDENFMNQFIFERALYLFAAIRFYPERDDIPPMVAENINTAWDALLEDNTIQEMNENYHEDLDNLVNAAETWFEDYVRYSNSANGLLNNLQQFTGDIVQQAAKTLQHSADNAGVTQVMEIAQNWGMGNEFPKEEATIEEDSLILE